MILSSSTANTNASPPTMLRKARKSDRQPRHMVNAKGDHIVQVTLKGGIIATLEAADFDRLICLGVSDQWCHLGDGKGHSYAGVWGQAGRAGTMLMVARLILDAPRGQVIRYADHNPMNLLRSNLVFATGFSKQREAGVKAGQDAGAEW